MASYLCVHEGGSYISTISEEDAIKRWALKVYRDRCQIFRLGESVLTMRVNKSQEVSWVSVQTI